MEYQGKVKIAKLNIDENPQTPPKFGIRGIPTLILFKNGDGRGAKGRRAVANRSWPHFWTATCERAILGNQGRQSLQ